MFEWLRHITGFCGEPHASLITLLATTPVVGYVIALIKSKNKK